MIVKSIVVLFLLLSLCNADTNVTTQQESNYIDETHTNLSKKVLEWSRTIDTTLSSWLGNSETNTTTVVTNVSGNISVDQAKSIDSFFQNDKYLDETDNTFVRIRVDSYSQSKESSDLNLRVSAQFPFNKSKKRYSLGLSGIDPFIKARYNMPIKTNGWQIDPVQLVKYSIEDEFEEETNIYFDKQFKERSLFRIQLHRKTQTKIDGMDYGLALQYYWSPKKDTGLRLSQSFWGNTEYKYIVDKNAEFPETKSYSGINNYVTSFSWRENIWRKWFFYEVRPGVNFHRQYDYKPNYTIRLFFDFYFGQYN